MDIDVEKTRLASLRQDYEYMRQTLGISGSRRILAGVIDVLFVISLAMTFKRYEITPWISLVYIMVRDLPPMNRSIGKTITGIRIYSADSLSSPTFLQLLFRGMSNLFIVIPVAIILATFFTISAAAIAAFGILIYFYGGDSWILRGLGFDYMTGQTIADRIAKTHLIQPRDLESMSRMAVHIEELRAKIYEK